MLTVSKLVKILEESTSFAELSDKLDYAKNEDRQLSLWESSHRCECGSKDPHTCTPISEEAGVHSLSNPSSPLKLDLQLLYGDVLNRQVVTRDYVLQRLDALIEKYS